MDWPQKGRGDESIVKKSIRGRTLGTAYKEEDVKVFLAANTERERLLQEQLKEKPKYKSLAEELIANEALRDLNAAALLENALENTGLTTTTDDFDRQIKHLINTYYPNKHVPQTTSQVKSSSKPVTRSETTPKIPSKPPVQNQEEDPFTKTYDKHTTPPPAATTNPSRETHTQKAPPPVQHPFDNLNIRYEKHQTGNIYKSAYTPNNQLVWTILVRHGPQYLRTSNPVPQRIDHPILGAMDIYYNRGQISTIQFSKENPIRHVQHDFYNEIEVLRRYPEERIPYNQPSSLVERPQYYYEEKYPQEQKQPVESHREPENDGPEL